MSLISRIDALLPQTQCGKCGHPGCKPYAEGIASGEAINKCPPGGDETIAALAHLMNVNVIALDTERGNAPPQVAFIREAECIGCTKCIQACPVDAILGAAKVMHTVVSDLCTGCELCVPACPVDCIVLDPMPLAQVDDRAHADAARLRFQRREARLGHEREAREEQLAASKRDVGAPAARNAVLEALARAKAKKKDTP
jgi:Na+-translocating ferredoxin:NAD+ oxidoreductase subunit B